VPTIQEMCTEARLLLDEPRPSKPPLRRLLLGVLQATADFYTQLELTGASWSVKPDYTLQVVGGQSDYQLSIDDSYGKPIQVLTYYPTNPSFIQRYVEFFVLNDLQFDWLLPQNIAAWTSVDGSNCTAARMAFYYKDDGSAWVRVLPQPQLSAQYLITFQSGAYASTIGLEQSPVLGQFHSLIETWAAQSVLPSCEWYDDFKENREKRRELAVSLKNDEARIADGFQRYIRSTITEHMTRRNDAFTDSDTSIWGRW
jgi:hypothetical protein